MVTAIREQNVQIAAGAVGKQPVAGAVDFELVVNAKGRLIDEKEFGEIIIKAGPSGELVRLGDVARVELGAGEFALRSRLNNRSAAAIPIFQQPGSNALDLSRNVGKTMAAFGVQFTDAFAGAFRGFA